MKAVMSKGDEVKKVSLISYHLHFDALAVSMYFGDESHVYAAFEETDKSLLITRASSRWFHKMHKDTTQLMLKFRNASGDKVLNIRMIAIDYGLQLEDQVLTPRWIKKSMLLKIPLHSQIENDRR